MILVLVFYLTFFQQDQGLFFHFIAHSIHSMIIKLLDFVFWHRLCCDFYLWWLKTLFFFWYFWKICYFSNFCCQNHLSNKMNEADLFVRTELLDSIYPLLQSFIIFKVFFFELLFWLILPFFFSLLLLVFEEKFISLSPSEVQFYIDFPLLFFFIIQV